MAILLDVCYFRSPARQEASRTHKRRNKTRTISIKITAEQQFAFERQPWKTKCRLVATAKIFLCNYLLDFQQRHIYITSFPFPPGWWRQF